MSLKRTKTRTLESPDDKRGYADVWVSSANKCRPSEDWHWEILRRDVMHEYQVLRALWMMQFMTGPTLVDRMPMNPVSVFAPPESLRSSWGGLDLFRRLPEAAEVSFDDGMHIIAQGCHRIIDALCAVFVRHGKTRYYGANATGHWTLFLVVSCSPHTCSGEQWMPNKREKTLSYRRAGWLEEGHGLTLERCLKEAHKLLKTVEERTIVYQGQHTKSLNFKEASAGGVFLHLSMDTPGEFASVVPKSKPGVADLDLQIASPPADGEWLDGDAFLFVRQNHVCMCATGMRDAGISSFIHQFFKKAELRKDATRFQLLKVADISKLRMLQKQGVKEIILKATVFQATASFEKRRTHAFSIVGAAAKQFKSLVTKPNDYTRDGLQVWLSIRSDHRFAKDFKLGEKQIEHVAADMLRDVQDEDDFTIVTQNGQKIGPNEIFMRETVLIDGEGKTVDRDKAWRELSAFYKRLHETGLLEQ